MQTEIVELLKQLGPGKMSATAYDTAWVARLGDIDSDLSNHALEWLIEHQLPDGGWGARVPVYYHDRVISTLAAMIALTQRGRRAHDRQQIDKGLLALEKITSGATKGLPSDPNGATVGFELIVPTLILEAEKLGIIKQRGESILGKLGNMRKLKLQKMKGYKINRHVTMAFSAEMAGVDGQDMLDVENLQEQNGSVGCSPSATAYFSIQVRRGDKKAMEYLHKIRRESGGAPNVAPFDVFEIAWTLWNLSLILGYNELKEKVHHHVDFLSKVWDVGNGAGFSSEYSVNDSDGTSMVFEILSRFGVSKKIDDILSFEDDERFRCFALERDPSVSANIHVLSALREAGYKKDNPSLQKTIQFLRRTKNTDGGWNDKWHISPYYTTAHAIIACAGYANELVLEAVDWISKTQRHDGSWGIFDSTAEETAYALQALWFWKEKGGNISKEKLSKGKAWLEEHHREYTPLWIGKCLYSPRLVIDSAILSALALENK